MAVISWAFEGKFEVTDVISSGNFFTYLLGKCVTQAILGLG